MRARAFVLLLLASCGDAAIDDVRATSQPIVKGTDSDASQDAVVLVIHYDALSKDGSAGCSGTMLAPRLVLTARHCVAVTEEKVACASDGTPVSGGMVMNDFDPTKIYVFAGKDRPDFISGVANVVRGTQIIDDGAHTLCNHDIALMLTERDVPGAKIAPIRLDGGPKKNETFTAIGWGITDTTNTTPVRQQRTGVTILDVGPGQDITPNEFLATEGACAGDSGGPALSAAGAVIGSLSRGGNGTGATGAAACDGGTNVYTSSSAFRDLILSAYDKAGAQPWLEGEAQPSPAPPPPTDDGKKGCSAAPRAAFDPLAALLVLAVLFRRRKPRS